MLIWKRSANNVMRCDGWRIVRFPWSDGATYASLFPGNHVWNNVPFALESRDGNNVFWGGQTDIAVNTFGVTSVYTLISSAWGVAGANVGSVQFFGSNGSYFSQDLIQGVNVRDHYRGGFNNSIDGVSAVAAVDNGPGRAGLDMQIFNLPGSFQYETLQTIRFTSAGGNPEGAPFLAAATVNAVPEPETWGMMLAGLGALALLQRKRRAALK